MDFDFVPLSVADGSWAQFTSDWQTKATELGAELEGYEEFVFPLFADIVEGRHENNHARQAYVYALRNPDGFLAVCQINVAPIPKYTQPVLRVRHLKFSPLYDFGDASTYEYGDVLVELLAQVMVLSIETVKAPHIHFHLPSPNDRSFFAALGRELSGQKPFNEVVVKGAWLYVDRR
jgi:hypothetical protein